MARSKRATRAASVKELPQLRPGGPLIGAAMPPTSGRYRQRTIDRAIDADLSRLNGIYAEAAYGRTNQLIDLCKSTYRYDSRLSAVIQTRVRALQSREWIIKPPPGYADDPEAKLVVERVTTILNETQGLKKVLGQLGYGPIEGFAVAEHAWRMNARNEWVSQPEWRHSNRFAWNVDTLELCRCEPGQDSPPGVPLSTWPGKFIVHSPSAGAADYPWQRGAVRSRLTASVIKRFGVRWWLKMLERWGQPQVFATLPPNLRTGAESEVDDALRALGSTWFARFPEGTTVETIAAQVNDQLHKAFVDWQNTEDAIAILGQNLTTEVTAGSFAAAKAHQLVRLDVLAADLAELAETITDQWIRWLVYYNWPGSPVPYIDFVLAPQGEITVAHYQAGLFTADEVRNAMGFDAEPDGKGARYFVPPPTFGAPPPAQTPAALPLGGAATAPPFTSSGPMRSLSTHPLVNSLSRR
jgi:phage gp29-like protein